jgi:hypothetical protein
MKKKRATGGHAGEMAGDALISQVLIGMPRFEKKKAKF